MRYKLRLIKPEDDKNNINRPENLRGQSYRITILNFFKASSSILDLPRKKKKQFIEHKLKNISSENINYDFEYSDKEEVKMFRQGDYKKPIFHGDIKFPKHLRKEDETLETVNYGLGDMR